jgi:hypothetical protein
MWLVGVQRAQHVLDPTLFGLSRLLRLGLVHRFRFGCHHLGETVAGRYQGA